MSENNQNTEQLNEEQAVDAVADAAFNEQPSAAVEQPAEQPSANTAVAVKPAPAPKKKMRPIALITAVLACFAVAGSLYAIKNFIAPKPENIIKQAYAATVAEQEKLTDEIYQTIPAAKRIFEPATGAAVKSDFDFTLKSIEGIDNAELISAIISDSGISGSALNDPVEGNSKINLIVDLKNKPLIEADIYISTDLVAASVPTFSDTVLSAAPKTFAADYKNSIFNKMAPMGDQELEMMQDLIIGELDYIKTLNNVSVKKLTEDITAILAKSLDNAVYSYNKDTKQYVVSIPGEDAKAAVIGYYRYLYLESELSPAMEKMMKPLLAVSGEADGDYASAMNKMIAEMESTIPPIETVISLDIEKNLIKKANIVATPAAVEGQPAIFSAPIVADIVIDGKNSEISMTFDIDGGQSGVGMNMVVEAAGKFDNDTYAFNFDVKVDSDVVKIAVPTALSISANGDFAVNAAVDCAAAGTDYKLGLTTNGKMTCDNDVLSLELPGSRVEYSVLGGEADTSGAVSFDYSQTDSPLTEKISAPEGCISVFSLTEKELQDIMDEYTSGAQGLIGKLMSALI